MATESHDNDHPMEVPSARGGTHECGLPSTGEVSRAAKGREHTQGVVNTTASVASAVAAVATAVIAVITFAAPQGTDSPASSAPTTTAPAAIRP
ncbi:hypothetical protein [Kitasatospora sp. NPDC058218]|uniref:hypothetical protein n=1 Tax=Kitasatospora sp. NPDC058218 TaxID=3346385 RepID=UPI0036D90B4C